MAAVFSMSGPAMRVSPITPEHDSVAAEDHPLLLAHQRHTLAAMWRMERECASMPLGGDPMVRVTSRVGIFGDKAGSGKSYVLAEMMLRSPRVPASTDMTRHLTRYLSVMFRADTASDEDVVPLSIMAIPHNLVSQWKRVLEHMSRDRPEAYMVVSKTAEVGGMGDALDACASRDPGAIRLLVVSSSFFSDAVMAVRARQMTIARMVYDEADSIRLQATGVGYDEGRFSMARFNWLVTASMQNLMSGVSVGYSVTISHSNGEIEHSTQYRHQLCNSGLIRDMLRVGFNASSYLSNIAVVTDNAFVDASFGLSEPEVNVIECTAPFHTRLLYGIASAEVMRRLNAGDIDSAIASLRPNRADTENNIISAAIAHLDAALANARTEHEYATRRNYATREAKQSAEQRTLDRVQACERDIANVTTRIREATSCPICYGDFQNKTVLPCCNNSFCMACITGWVVPRGALGACPMCKSPTSPSQFMVCREEASTSSEPRSRQFTVGGVRFDAEADKRTNLRALLAAIKTSPDSHKRKILFFSDNEYANENVAEPAMREANIRFGVLKGNSQSVNKRMREFHADGETQALLINLTHYGCGMDLSRATDLVLYHRVARRMDHQVVGRAQRPPRTDRLRVWRLVNHEEQD
nr:putative helicase [Oceanusvirus sp.]